MGSCSSKTTSHPHSITLLSRLNKESIPEAQLATSKSDLRMVDHIDTFINSELSFIEGIKFCYGQYIRGMQVCYSINLQKKTVNLMGTGPHKTEKIVRFEEGEYIDSLTLYHDKIAVTAIKLTTTTGKEELIGNQSEGNSEKEINLRDLDKVVLGFRGLVGEYLKDLEVYQTQVEVCLTQED